MGVSICAYSGRGYRGSWCRGRPSLFPGEEGRGRVMSQARLMTSSLLFGRTRLLPLLFSAFILHLPPCFTSFPHTRWQPLARAKVSPAISISISVSICAKNPPSAIPAPDSLPRRIQHPLPPRLVLRPLHHRTIHHHAACRPARFLVVCYWRIERHGKGKGIHRRSRVEVVWVPAGSYVAGYRVGTSSRGNNDPLETRRSLLRFLRLQEPRPGGRVDADGRVVGGRACCVGDGEE